MAPTTDADDGIDADDRLVSTDADDRPGSADAETRLPPEFGATTATFLGRGDRPETVTEWARAIRETVAEDVGRELGVDDLCHTDRETPHVAQADGETYTFLCPFDGVVLAGMVGEATVESECPTTGETVRFVAEGTDVLETTPSTAVFSLGIAADPPTPEDGGSPALFYGAICPHVKAFADRAAYREWAADHDADTVAVGPEEALRATAALIGE